MEFHGCYISASLLRERLEGKIGLQLNPVSIESQKKQQDQLSVFQTTYPAIRELIYVFYAFTLLISDIDCLRNLNHVSAGTIRPNDQSSTKNNVNILALAFGIQLKRGQNLIWNFWEHLGSNFSFQKCSAPDSSTTFCKHLRPEVSSM